MYYTCAVNQASFVSLKWDEKSLTYLLWSHHMVSMAGSTMAAEHPSCICFPFSHIYKPCI